MNRSIFLVRIGCAALISAGIFAHAEPVEQRYKNIQALKGAEAKELIPAMDFIRGALGVDCFYCHSASGRFPEGYEKDDLRAKQVAREMIRMMKQINETSFHGRQVVTCATCHNGHARPQVATTIAAPAALKDAFAKPPSAARAAEAPLPDAAELFAKYEAAIGGEAALSKLTTRHVVASVTAANGLVTKMESFYKASGDLFWQQTDARAPVVMGFDGTNAFRASGADVRTLNDTDAEEVRLVGLFYRNLRPKMFIAKSEPFPEKNWTTKQYTWSAAP